MKRDIRFRVWDVEQRKMLSWDEVWYSVCRLPAGTLPEQPEEIWFPFLSLALKSPESKYLVDQWTGLKDRNGIDIYEGDIVSECGKTGVVEYDLDHCACAYRLTPVERYHRAEHRGVIYWAFIPTERTVLGNVHQHPHLLTPSS